MKNLIQPVAVAVIMLSSAGMLLKVSQDRRALRDQNAALVRQNGVLANQNAALTERLSRAEAVSEAVVKIDSLYRQEQQENADLTKRLALAQAASRARRRQPEFRDAVADRPAATKPAPAQPKPAVILALPGYGR